MKNSKKYFPVLPHGSLEEVLPNVFAVTGTMNLFGLFRYSRVMTILKHNDELSILNPVRVDENLLEKLKELGRIERILKIGQLHNVDLPLYMDQFAPQLWCNKDDPSIGDYSVTGFFDDHQMLPEFNAHVKVIEGSRIKESVLVTPEDGGCLHSCDAFVNMGIDPNHNWLTAKLSKLLPDPTYIGPNWIKAAKPPERSMREVLANYEFENFVPAHGRPIIGNAKDKLSCYIDSFYF